MEYNDIIKAALKVTFHERSDHIIYIDGNGAYHFILGEKGNLVNPGVYARFLGWTEFFTDQGFPKARLIEFEHPLTFEELRFGTFFCKTLF